MTNVGIIGLGRFGKLLAGILESDFALKGFDRDPAVHASSGIGAPLEEVTRCETLFFCVPISGIEQAVADAAPHLTNRTTVLDVCSVKLHAVEVMKRAIPSHVHFLPTHPMFGPDAAVNGMQGLPFVLCPIDRTEPGFLREFSAYLAERGFLVVQMTPDEHDRAMAFSLCITQLIGRALDRVGVEPSPSDTRNFRHLLHIREVACNDSVELFRDLQTLNPYAAVMRQRLAAALGEIERDLATAHEE